MSLKRKASTTPHDDAKKPRTSDSTYNDDDADVTVISSDNVAFRIYAFYLQALSPVFRTMVQTAVADDSGAASSDSRTVIFTDLRLERAAVLKLLLNMATSVPLDDFDDIAFDTVADLIRVCDKYDCSTPLRLLGYHLVHPIAIAGIHHYYRFFYACILDRIDLAHDLLPRAASANFPRKNKSTEEMLEVPFETGLPGGSGLDVTSMGSHWIEKLPNKYFLALLRASRLRFTSPPGPATWQLVADEFKRLLELKKTKASDTETASEAT